jgi:hypothetical protein
MYMAIPLLLLLLHFLRVMQQASSEENQHAFNVFDLALAFFRTHHLS